MKNLNKYVPVDIVINGKLVKKLRERKGIKQHEFSDLADLTHGIMSRIEAGKYKNPSLRTTVKIARMLDCSIEDLIIN